MHKILIFLRHFIPRTRTSFRRLFNVVSVWNPDNHRKTRDPSTSAVIVTLSFFIGSRGHNTISCLVHQGSVMIPHAASYNVHPVQTRDRRFSFRSTWNSTTLWRQRQTAGLGTELFSNTWREIYRLTTWYSHWPAVEWGRGGEISAVYRAIPSRINVHKYSPALLCTERRKCSMKRAVLEAKQFKKYEFSTKFSNDMAWCLYDHH